MATLEQCIEHYKIARKAVRENNAKLAATELYNFLNIVANAAQTAVDFDKQIFEKVFNSYYPIYVQLKHSGVTKEVREALCISISDVFNTDSLTSKDQVLPPVTPISESGNGAIPPSMPPLDVIVPPQTPVIPPIVPPENIDVIPPKKTVDTENGRTSSEKKDEIDNDATAIVDHAGGLRPETFDDFIGQTQAVNRLKTAIAVAKMDGKHCIADKGGILFKGTTGLGKTTLMRIVANELGVEFKEFNTATLQASTKSQGGFEDFIENIAKKNVPVVIGMDEIHMIPAVQETMLLTLLEDRVYKKIGNGEDIILTMPEFTFIGATTDADKLSSAHRGRYQKGLVLELVDYTPEEWRKIVIQKFNFYGLEITEGAVKEVVGRSRSSVRDVEGYVEHIYQKARISHISKITEEFVKQHFADEGIEANGLYAIDVKILEALESARDYTLSEENLCSKVNIGIGSFREERKPFLVRLGFIESYNRGQKLTYKALEFLKSHRENSDMPGDTDATAVDVSSDSNIIDSNQTQNNDADVCSTQKQIISTTDTATKVTEESLLELLTGKYTKMTVEKNIICDELNASLEDLNKVIETLCKERLINIKPLGIIATIDAYKKLGKPFNPLD